MCRLSLLTGPTVQENVFLSGSQVNQTVTSFPSIISFIINDDDIDGESEERYLLTLTTNDTEIIISQATTQIIIFDDDRKFL